MAIKKQFHWFWAWNDELQEAWLRQMSQQGWHLKSLEFISSYVFEEGEPTDYVYRLDYFIDRKNQANYLQLFNDTGWDHLGEMGGWQYFRKEATTSKAPEIYNDNESKAKKYQRILMYLVIFLPIYINSIVLINNRDSDNFQIITFLMFSLFVFYIYAMIRLLYRYRQLRKGL